MENKKRVNWYTLRYITNESLHSQIPCIDLPSLNRKFDSSHSEDMDTINQVMERIDVRLNELTFDFPINLRDLFIMPRNEVGLEVHPQHIRTILLFLDLKITAWLNLRTKSVRFTYESERLGRKHWPISNSDIEIAKIYLLKEEILPDDLKIQLSFSNKLNIFGNSAFYESFNEWLLQHITFGYDQLRNEINIARKDIERRVSAYVLTEKLF